MEGVEYRLFFIPLNGLVEHGKTFTHKSEAILAFDAVVNDGKMKAVFLDQCNANDHKAHSAINLRKWRKRANKTKGQSR